MTLLFFVRLGQILVQIDALAQENTIPSLNSHFREKMTEKISKNFGRLANSHPVDTRLTLVSKLQWSD